MRVMFAKEHDSAVPTGLHPIAETFPSTGVLGYFQAVPAGLGN